MKELTYLHCQCFNTRAIANHFFGYVKTRKEPVPCVFLVLQETAAETISVLRKLQECKLPLYSVIITDVTDKEQCAFLEQFAGAREQVFYVPRSGPAFSALLCVVPLQRLSYDVTIALGYDPDRPRNLAKELTTQ